MIEFQHKKSKFETVMIFPYQIKILILFSNFILSAQKVLDLPHHYVHQLHKKLSYFNKSRLNF